MRRARRMSMDWRKLFRLSRRKPESGARHEAAQVAKALIIKGLALGDLGRRSEAIAVYDEVTARFGAAREIALREQVATALVNKGTRLNALNRDSEALTVYADVGAIEEAS